MAVTTHHLLFPSSPKNNFLTSPSHFSQNFHYFSSFSSPIVKEINIVTNSSKFLHPSFVHLVRFQAYVKFSLIRKLGILCINRLFSSSISLVDLVMHLHDSIFMILNLIWQFIKVECFLLGQNLSWFHRRCWGCFEYDNDDLELWKWMVISICKLFKYVMWTNLREMISFIIFSLVVLPLKLSNWESLVHVNGCLCAEKSGANGWIR